LIKPFDKLRAGGAGEGRDKEGIGKPIRAVDR